MSDKSAIEWTDATWNPVTGCTKVSQGCKNCYAERDWTRLSANPKTVYYKRRFTDIRCHWDRIDIPGRWKNPRMIFVNSMSDIFSDGIPDQFISAVFSAMHRASWHTFQLLTKRAERMRDFYHVRQSIADDHVWHGVSIELAEHMDRLEHLRQTPAKVRFVSFEPLLGDVGKLDLAGIGWVIVGGESGSNARPMYPNGVRKIRDQCLEADVPFFFKGWGEWAPVDVTDSRLTKNRRGWFDLAGQFHEFARGVEKFAPDRQTMERVGRKAAGRELDGRAWDEFPTIEVKQ